MHVWGLSRRPGSVVRAGLSGRVPQGVPWRAWEDAKVGEGSREAGSPQGALPGLLRGERTVPTARSSELTGPVRERDLCPESPRREEPLQGGAGDIFWHIGKLTNQFVRFAKKSKALRRQHTTHNRAFYGGRFGGIWYTHGRARPPPPSGSRALTSLQRKSPRPSSGLSLLPLGRPWQLPVCVLSPWIYPFWIFT